MNESGTVLGGIIGAFLVVYLTWKVRKYRHRLKEIVQVMEPDMVGLVASLQDMVAAGQLQAVSAAT